MVIETMLAAIYVLLQPLLPPLLLPPTKPPTPTEHHIRVAFKGGRVYPGRAGASQPETDEQKHHIHGKQRRVASKGGPVYRTGPGPANQKPMKTIKAIGKPYKNGVQGRPGLPGPGRGQPARNQ